MRAKLSRYLFLSTSFLSAALLFAVTATSAHGQTVIFNESFETPDASMGDVPLNGAITGVNQFGDPSQTFITDDDGGSDGLQALNIFGPFGGGGTGFTVTGLPASAGETLVAEIAVLTPTDDAAPAGSDGETLLQIIFRDAAGGFAGTAAGGNQAEGFNFFQESAGQDFNSALDIFETLGVGTAPAPDNTASADIILVRLNNGNAGGSQLFDNLTVTTAVVPEPTSLVLLGASGLVMVSRRRRVA